MVGPLEKTGGVSNHTFMLLKEYKNMGVYVREYNISSQHNYLNFLNNIIKLFKRTILLFLFLIFYRKRFDIIHIQASGPIGGFLPAMIASFTKVFFRFTLVITFHHGKSELFIKNHKKIFKFVINKTDLLILVSQEQKEIIQRYFNKEYSEKIIVISNGYDKQMTEKLYQTKQISMERNDFINIINVSNLYPIKGQQYLISAIYILIKKYKITNIKCKIIGEGPLFNELNSLIHKYDLQQNIFLLGWLPQNEIRKYLIKSDFFVLPSLNEGSPLVLFEALGFGLPIIGSKIGGIPDIITSDNYGLLVKPGDPIKLAEVINNAISKKWDKEKIIDYSKKYSWRNIAQMTYDSYQRVIKKN
jgi:glycosyltransferase involved in cell wall biosynthesis